MSCLFGPWFGCRRASPDDAYLDVTLESTGESSSVPPTLHHQQQDTKRYIPALEVSESTDTSNSEFVSYPVLEELSRPTKDAEAAGIVRKPSEEADLDAVSAWVKRRSVMSPPPERDSGGFERSAPFETVKQTIENSFSSAVQPPESNGEFPSFTETERQALEYRHRDSSPVRSVEMDDLFAMRGPSPSNFDEDSSSSSEDEIIRRSPFYDDDSGIKI